MQDADATRGQRCLSRLCGLPGPLLLIRLWPVVLRIARLVDRFRNQPLAAAAMQQFETELAGLFTEMGRIVVPWTLNHLEALGAAAMSPELFWHNDHYRRKRRSPTRNRNCLFGKVRVRRWMYQPTEGLSQSALFPLELSLGLVAGVATPALADRVTLLSVDFSQRQVLAILRDQHHVYWGAETLRKSTQAWRRR